MRIDIYSPLLQSRKVFPLAGYRNLVRCPHGMREEIELSLGDKGRVEQFKRAAGSVAWIGEKYLPLFLPLLIQRLKVAFIHVYFSPDLDQLGKIIAPEPQRDRPDSLDIIGDLFP